MKRPILMTSIATVFVLAAAGTTMAACAATSCTPDDASLDRAIAATVGAVRGNDPQAFMAQVSREGLAMGTDGPLVSVQALTNQFASRTGRYCDLFNCGGRDGDMHARFQMGPMDKSIDTKHGLASVFINANTDDELDLSYKWSAQQCRWELTGAGVP